MSVSRVWKSPCPARKQSAYVKVNPRFRGWCSTTTNPPAAFFRETNTRLGSGPMAFQRYITNGGGFWFHFQGVPVGVGILNPRLSSLGALAVAKEHRGHGLGKAIVEFLQPNFVRAVEDKVLYFENLGFVPVGKMKKGIRLNVQVIVPKVAVPSGRASEEATGPHE